MGRVQGAIVGAQKAVESNAGQLSMGVATLGVGMAAEQSMMSMSNKEIDISAEKAMLPTKEGEVINEIFHGNDLRSTAVTYGYNLLDKTSGAIMKIGQTINPSTRYSQKWMNENNLILQTETLGTKMDVRVWEHEQIGNYIFKNGEAPTLNNISRSVNVFK